MMRVCWRLSRGIFSFRSSIRWNHRDPGWAKSLLYMHECPNGSLCVETTTCYSRPRGDDPPSVSSWWILHGRDDDPEASRFLLLLRRKHVFPNHSEGVGWRRSPRSIALSLPSALKTMSPFLRVRILLLLIIWISSYLSFIRMGCVIPSFRTYT